MAKNKDFEKFICGLPFEKFDDKRQVFNFFVRNTLNKSLSMFKYKNLPDTIPEYSLKLQLQTNGFCIFDKLSKNDIHLGDYPEGVYTFSHGVGLGGVPDVYYRPTLAIINSPALGYSASKRINKECFLLRNDPLLLGLTEIMTHYSSLLTENIITMRMADINTRIFNLFKVQRDTEKDAVSLFYKDLAEGKPSAIVGKDLLEDKDSIASLPFSGRSEVFTHLIEYHQYLKASLYNELGLNANFNMKREALNSSESALNEHALLPFIDVMYQTQKEDLERINKELGLDIQIEYNSSWEDIQKEAEETEETKKSEDVNEETKEGDQKENETE